MSWQAYVDTSLIGTGHVDKGAVLSLAGDSAWASSSDLQLTVPEMKAISDIVQGNEAARNKAYGEGLYIGGVRYVLTKADDVAVYARKDRDGVAIAKSKSAIVVGHHGETGNAGNATSAVTSLAKYLTDQGY